MIMPIHALFSTRRKKEIRNALRRGDTRVFSKAQRETFRKRAQQMEDVLRALRLIEKKLGLEEVKKAADSLENDPTEEADKRAIDTLLIASALANDLEGVKKALSFGADIHADAAPFGQSDENGNACSSAIQIARTKGYIDISMFLAQKGGRNRPKPSDEKQKWNAQLRRASARGVLHEMLEAIGKGADVDAQDEKGRNALMFAIHYGHTGIVKLLIGKNADVNAKAMHDVTALMLASNKGSVEIAELLIAQNADVTAKNVDGATALQYASLNGHEEVAELLRRHGATEGGP